MLLQQSIEALCQLSSLELGGSDMFPHLSHLSPSVAVRDGGQRAAADNDVLVTIVVRVLDEVSIVREASHHLIVHIVTVMVCTPPDGETTIDFTKMEEDKVVLRYSLQSLFKFG